MPTPTPSDTPDAKVPVRHRFAICYKTSRGEVFEGEFENHILTVGETQQAELGLTERLRGMDFDKVPGKTFQMAYELSWMELSLSKRPPWAKSLEGLYSAELVHVIYAEVVKHERRFHGTADDAPPGDKDGSAEP
jgi:hypothetical protein